MNGNYIFDQDEQRFHEHVDNVIKPHVHWSPSLAVWCKLMLMGLSMLQEMQEQG
jgi:hypothetical protein